MQMRHAALHSGRIENWKKVQTCYQVIIAEMAETDHVKSSCHS